MSSDSDWIMPATNPAAIDNNIRVMATDLKDLGYTEAATRDIIAWSESLTFINPAYYGTRWSDASNPEYQAGLLSWRAAVVRPWLSSHGYADNSGYGQLLFFDSTGPSMIYDLPTGFTPDQYWNNLIKTGYTVLYQLYYHYFKGWIPDTYLQLLYEDALGYRDHIHEVIHPIFNPKAPTWLIYEMSKRKKGGGKLYL